MSTDVKDEVYRRFAAVAQALASPSRLHLIDLLAQSPLRVDALARETGLSVANVSQHLQVLRAVKLVMASRHANSTMYRLADEEVARFWVALARLAESRLPEVRELARSIPNRDIVALPRDEAQTLGRRYGLLLDVRPPHEFKAGHLRGALNIPISELPGRLDELPRDRKIVTYCRGEYCQMADEAAALLRARGYDVVRLDGGWPEWQAEGRPTAIGGAN